MLFYIFYLCKFYSCYCYSLVLGCYSNIVEMSIVLGSFFSLTFIIGFGLGCLILVYLRKKPLINKTSFDQSLSDSIAMSLLFGFSLLATLILSLNFAPLSYEFASIFSIAQYFVFHLTLVSWLVTMVIKYLFIFHGHFIFELPDELVWRVSNVSKILMVGIIASLDNTVPINQNNIRSFDLLIKDQIQG